MTQTMTGHLDGVITKVIVDSEESKEVMINYAKQALFMCFAGEGIQKVSEMETAIYLNGEIIK